MGKKLKIWESCQRIISEVFNMASRLTLHSKSDMLINNIDICCIYFKLNKYKILRYKFSSEHKC